MLSNSIPQILYDVYLDVGNDLVFDSSNGDLKTVFGALRGEQRIVRRLVTNPVDYIWEPTYGAGIPQLIGQALSSDLFDQIKSIIQSNIFLEAVVAQTPPPEIFLQSIPQGLFCQINYTDNPSQNPIVLTFDVSAIP